MPYDPSPSTQRGMRNVRRLGFRLPTEPEFSQPELPHDITEISEQDLMILFGELSSWLDYAEYNVTCHQIDEKQEQQTLEELEAKEQIRHRAEKTVKAARAFALENPEILAQRDKLITLFAKKRLLETIQSSLERRQFIVSREITRRKYGE